MNFQEGRENGMDQSKKNVERIDVYTPDTRPKFELWIKERGGVQVWHNQNLSNPGAGNQFTPATMMVKDPDDVRSCPGSKIGDIVPYPKPHWSVGRGEVITDITRFRVAKGFKEFKHRKDGGLFDPDREIVVEVPEWEE